MKQLGEAVRLMKRIETNLDTRQILNVVESFSRALDLLDDYNHQTMKRPKGSTGAFVLSYEECRRVIDQMRFGAESDLFGSEKEVLLRAASEISINLLPDRKYILPWRKRQRIYCILYQKITASGTATRELQQPCSCIFWIGTGFCMGRTASNCLMTIHWLP